MTTLLSHSIPAYSRLQQALALKINTGQWKPGDQLPPERQLAEEYRLSVGTVRKAMELLVQAGYCYRVQGKGTFVTDYPSDQAVFYRVRSSFADNDAALLPYNIQRTISPASEEAASAMHLKSGAPCICISRCLSGRDATGMFPLGWSISYFSLPRCGGLLRTPPEDFKKHSLYFLAERDCRLPSLFCDELIYAKDGLPAEVQAKLGIHEHTPCFEMHMISYSYEKIPFEFRLSYVPGGTRGIMRRHDLRL